MKQLLRISAVHHEIEAWVEVDDDLLPSSGFVYSQAIQYVMDEARKLERHPLIQIERWGLE